jgi:hypothetical protein
MRTHGEGSGALDCVTLTGWTPRASSGAGAGILYGALKAAEKAVDTKRARLQAVETAANTARVFAGLRDTAILSGWTPSSGAGAGNKSDAERVNKTGDFTSTRWSTLCAKWDEEAQQASTVAEGRVLLMELIQGNHFVCGRISQDLLFYVIPNGRSIEDVRIAATRLRSELLDEGPV